MRDYIMWLSVSRCFCFVFLPLISLSQTNRQLFFLSSYTFLDLLFCRAHQIWGTQGTHFLTLVFVELLSCALAYRSGCSTDTRCRLWGRRPLWYGCQGYHSPQSQPQRPSPAKQRHYEGIVAWCRTTTPRAVINPWPGDPGSPAVPS